ncbi:nucleotidyltransferase family protein [Bacillus sp. FJAT-27245]|uniref:nucleotidyltransferase family protein n=1 Tax=Bacillus sp. FJAT-27245 TaxID=1684144 RepID=UPI0006A78549|nr:nucleotidyltransferase family protein [Bacillus sp. FJAT-27245]
MNGTNEISPHTEEALRQKLIGIVEGNKWLQEAFSAANHILGEYYIGAGAVTQAVWNEISGYHPQYGIGDMDIVYFNGDDLTEEGEKSIETRIQSMLQPFPFKIDVKNEARVHLWYEKKFGYRIKPYTSLEAAIDTWPTTATAIGIRKDEKGTYTVYAPYGLGDMFGMIVRANKVQITKEIYEAKAFKWKSKWPALTVIPWEG